MRTLCLGGSFNPVHHGHLICARAVAETAGYDRVLLVPGGQPPHKPGRWDLADASDRLHMCRLAAQAAAPSAAVRFDVDDIELSRPGPSYTIDTVLALKQRGWGEVHWLIGADMLAQLPSWHRPQDLLREAKLLVMARPGVAIDFASLPAQFAPLRDCLVSAPLIDISSTEIRRRVRAGLGIDYLTPPTVVDYIHARSLYR